jgi:pseudaminic acid cytidylyltransferase
MRRIAIIPARGGSKRIPQKNIKIFCGKPMISYPIQALKESNLFNKIHVSTDEERVIDVVNQLGLEVDFYRPINLSDDYTPIMPVIKYVVEEYRKMNQIFDEVWVILPCSPLLNTKDLVNASINFKQLNSSNPLMAVTEYPVPIEWAFETNEKGVLKPLNKGDFAIRSQDLKKKYYDAGMFYIYPQEFVLNSDYFGTDENIIPYFLSKGNAIDIDDQEDWDYAEKLFKVK